MLVLRNLLVFFPWVGTVSVWLLALRQSVRVVASAQSSPDSRRHALCLWISGTSDNRSWRSEAPGYRSHLWRTAESGSVGAGTPGARLFVVVDLARQVAVRLARRRGRRRRWLPQELGPGSVICVVLRLLRLRFVVGLCSPCVGGGIVCSAVVVVSVVVEILDACFVVVTGTSVGARVGNIVGGGFVGCLRQDAVFVVVSHFLAGLEVLGGLRI